MFSLPRCAGPAAATLMLALAIFVLVSVAQTLSPGEVRLSSRPYVLGVGLRAESRLVDLEVVVRDKGGRAVLGLTKDEFAVYDSGKSRDIAAFSVDTFSEPVDTAPRRASPPSDTQA